MLNSTAEGIELSHGKGPLRIYLDSSDYSVLSQPGRSERDAPGVLEALRHHIARGDVEVFYSGAHLSEMAPLQPEYTGAADLRASLLAELCGKNVLVSLDRLMRLEVQFALGKLTRRADPIRRDGEWFPEGVIDLLPRTDAEQADAMREVIGEFGRAERRKAAKFLLKGGKPKRAIQQGLLANARSASLDEVMEKFPMKLQSARVLTRYLVGDATAEAATEAMKESMLDPSWMMKWFEQHHAQLTPFIAWVRGPAQNLVEGLLKLSNQIADARERLPSEMVSEMLDDRWPKWQESMLESLANRVANEIEPGATLAASQIDDACAGISTAVRSVHSAWRTIASEKPRAPKPSDFTDLIHAAYAPYVDVFRADSFMAPHISRYASKWGTIVVPKLVGLPSAIERLTQARPGAAFT